jgi:hypothetical protein
MSLTAAPEPARGAAVSILGSGIIAPGFFAF